MRTAVKVAFRLGCLISVLAPVVAIIVYPRAKWLFALILLGVVILWLDRRLAKDPTPTAMADQIERLLLGNYEGWDVDDFEMLPLNDPVLKEFHRKCMVIGLPEEWPKLDQEKKDELHQIISELRQMRHS
jgi:hypothetical protein